jgi:sarcosine oxidase
LAWPQFDGNALTFVPGWSGVIQCSYSTRYPRTGETRPGQTVSSDQSYDFIFDSCPVNRWHTLKGNTIVTDLFDVAVVGNGMIGAAASRYLSAAGLRVLAIGPEEPADWQSHTGVFASHHDQGRITRIIDPDDVWAVVGARSIAAYQELEEASGLGFHSPVGCLRVSPFYGEPGDTLAQAAANGDANGARYAVLAPGQLSERFPVLDFDPRSTALWEESGAGYVNPLAMVAAQLRVAANQGAVVRAAQVAHVRRHNGVVELATSDGVVYRAAKALIAAGAYTNHLVTRPLDLRPKAVSVLLAALGPDEVARLGQMPSIIYRLAGHPTLYSIYALPPITYPDGRTYLKIGGTLFDPIYRHTHDELVEWFHSAGNPDETGALQPVLEAMVPGLRVASYATRPCVVTYTAHDRPYVDLVEGEPGQTGQIYVAAGGCGAAAKSSNELGRIAALLVEHETWRYDLPAEIFRAVPLAKTAIAD